MSSPATRGIGDNKGPLMPPSEDELLDDLRARYPEVEPKLKELTESAASAPKKIDNDEDAGKVQDLYRTIKKYQSTWKAWRGVEKGPWDKLAKTALNFFKDPEDKLDTIALDLRARHTEFTELKAEKTRAEAAKRAEAERAEADRLRKEAEAAETRRAEAERAQREAEEREARARAEEEAAKERKRLADEAAERARAEEKRIADEKRARETAAKEMNAEVMRQAKPLLKEAKDLHDAAEADEESEPSERLAELVKEYGEIDSLLVNLDRSVLTDEQREQVESLDKARKAMRLAMSMRSSAKERKKHAAAEKKREAEDAAAAEERRKVREADEARAAEARRQREGAEAEALKARQEAKDARKDVRAAQGEQDDAAGEARAAEREGGQIGKQADKVERRADRLDNKLATSSDADMSRTRGGFSVGSLSGRWSPRVKDRDALVATFGVLGPYINPDAVDAALTKYMRQHQGEWADKRKDEMVEIAALPGTIFDWIPDSRIV